MDQTRHTFATLALSSVEALDWVSTMLGHRTTQMVIRHYHKYVPNLTRRNGDALARPLDKWLRPRWRDAAVTIWLPQGRRGLRTVP
jgi:integrase